MNIEQKIMPVSPARPGTRRTGFAGVTIHETANYKRSADAAAHAAYMQGSGRTKQVSAHYYVDDRAVVQCIPEREIAWHAGDGGAGNGNLRTVAIEICENWGYTPLEYTVAGVKSVSKASEQEKADALERFTKAVHHAAALTADILQRNGVHRAAGAVFMHHHWSGKDCPHNIRKNIPFSWETYLATVQALLDGNTAPPAKEETGKLYRVQVGAFSSKANADAYLAKLTSEGIQGFVKEEE